MPCGDARSWSVICAHGAYVSTSIEMSKSFHGARVRRFWVRLGVCKETVRILFFRKRLISTRIATLDKRVRGSVRAIK